MIETKNAEKIHFEIAPLIKKGATYLDALVEYADKHNIEIEALGEMIRRSSVLKDKIREEAVKSNNIKGDNPSEWFCD